jgi:hypothetical protein
MSDLPLGRLKIRRLSGLEVFHNNGVPHDFAVADFWSWSTSDLVDNTTRGVLAEYIVARALAIPTDQARDDWGAFDLRTDEGLRIEVKSAAYVQSWTQQRLSTIQFVVSKRLGWDPETNEMGTEARRHADIYVFALLAHRDKTTIDPLDLSQWQFWAVPTRDLDERSRSQHSITLTSLLKLAGDPVGFEGLTAAVNEAAHEYGGV